MSHFGPGLLAGGDPFTKALLHMDGALGGQVFQDSAAPSRVWTPSSTLPVTNVNPSLPGPAFGPTVGDFGLAQGVLTTPFDASICNPGAQDFTVDCWFYIRGGDGTARFLFGATSGGAVNVCWAGFVNPTNQLQFSVFQGGVEKDCGLGSTVLQQTVWHHFAGVRSGNTLMCFLDGVKQPGVDTSLGATPIDAATDPFNIGQLSAASSQDWRGSIDEFRISIGVARWTANFTPPTAPYI
jgi:concanavalin A-like lectin/glucanase superfamily protein